MAKDTTSSKTDNFSKIDNKKKTFKVIQTEETNYKTSSRLQFNEWKFTLFLFLLSFIVIIGKLLFNLEHLSFYYKNIDINFKNIIIDNVKIFSTEWLVKAIISGLSITGVTWFIIYEDSKEPGINPPSPLKTLHRSTSEKPSFNLNYFIGILSGILTFIYMCL